MTEALELVPEPGAPDAAQAARRRVFEAWQASVSPATRQAYLQRLQHWVAWRRSWSAGRRAELLEVLAELDRLLQDGKLEAESSTLAYFESLRAADCSPATVRHHRAALRSLIGMAEDLGVIAWTLRARLPRGDRRKRRAVAGPTLEQFLALRHAAATATSPLKAARDFALLGVIFTLRLREAEVCRLRIGNYDGRTLCALTKGHRDTDTIELAPATRAELDAYLALRGPLLPTLPLFASHDRADKGTGALSRSGLYRLVRELARRAGVPGAVSPHRLLHTASTALLQAGYTTDQLQAWGRWENRETADAYNDAHQAVAQRLTIAAAELLGAAAERVG